MVQIIQAKDITLVQLVERFALQRSDDEQFFPEWQHDLPELNDLEKQYLNQVKAEYLHLSQYQILEPVVKMVVLSPLLRLAGFYQPPFYIRPLAKVLQNPTPNPSPQAGRGEFDVSQRRGGVLVFDLCKKSSVLLRLSLNKW